MARDSFIFGRKILFTIRLRQDSGQTSFAASGRTIDSAQIEEVGNNMHRDQAAFLFLGFEKLNQSHEDNAAQSQSVFVRSIELCSIVLLQVFRQSKRRQGPNVMLMLNLEWLTISSKEVLRISREIIANEIEERIDKERPKQSLQLRLVDVEYIIDPFAGQVVCSEIASTAGFIQAIRYRSAVSVNIGTFATKHSLRTAIPFLGEILEDLRDASQ